MSEYHKINSLFKRDQSGKRLLLGEYAQPEFEYLRRNEWLFTEKVDGTNIRVIVHKEPAASCNQGIEFRGKTDNAQIPAKLVARLQERFLGRRIELVRNKFPDGAVLYGEGFGPGIQSGGNYRKDQDIVLFDVRVGTWWLGRADIEEVASYLGIEVVPLVGSGNLDDFARLVNDGFDSRWGAFRAEGIVARPKVELQTRAGERVITKLKYKDYDHGGR